MIEKINRTAEIKERLKREGKTKFLDSKENVEAMVTMNEIMRMVKREYLVKDRLSQVSASQTFLNA